MILEDLSQLVQPFNFDDGLSEKERLEIKMMTDKFANSRNIIQQTSNKGRYQTKNSKSPRSITESGKKYDFLMPKLDIKQIEISEKDKKSHLISLKNNDQRN